MTDSLDSEVSDSSPGEASSPTSAAHEAYKSKTYRYLVLGILTIVYESFSKYAQQVIVNG